MMTHERILVICLIIMSQQVNARYPGIVASAPQGPGSVRIPFLRTEEALPDEINHRPDAPPCLRLSRRLRLGVRLSQRQP
jgi:hypothetical protein